MSNKKIFITTKGHLEWDDSLQQYIHVSDEGYEYDGPVAQAGGTPNRQTGSWAFYDDGTEAAATQIGLLNEDPTLNTFTIYHWREVIQEIDGNTWSDADIQLEYKLNAGAWTSVNATSSVIQSAPTSGLVEGGDVTDRITGTGAFEDYAGQDDTDGYTTDGEKFANEYANCVFGFTIIDADITDGDTISLRLWDTVALDTFNSNLQADPIITVNSIPDPDIGVSIARWVLDEASTGQVPTECADDTGNTNTLAITYNTTDMNWTNIGAGNGLTTNLNLHSAIATLADVSTNGNIGSALDGKTKCSFVLRADLTAGDTNSSRVFHLGTSAGNGQVALGTTLTEINVRFNDVIMQTYTQTYPAGLHTYVVVLDTTQIVQADRCKLYIDSILETPATSAGVLNDVLATDSTTIDMCLFNRPDLTRGAYCSIYYAELFTGYLTATQASDIHTALVLDNDSNWVAGDVTVTPAAATAIAKSVNPTTLQGDITLTPTATNAIAKSINPTTLQGDITYTPTASSSIAKSVNPTVTITNPSVTITPAAVTAIAKSVNPTVGQSDITITPAAINAIAKSIDPTTLQSDINLTPSVASSIASVVEPLVLPYLLYMEVQALDLISTNTITVYGADFEIDWGSGSFTGYTNGTAASAVATGTGAIIVRSDGAAASLSFSTNTFTTINISSSNSLTSMWRLCRYMTVLTSFDIDDASSVLDCSSAWDGCSGLTSFPLIDLSSCTKFGGAWRGCTGLTSFPLIDTSAADNISATWHGCSSLTSFPLIDSVNALSLRDTWNGCSSLTSFPLIVLTNNVSCWSAWEGCTSLTTMPAIDFSNNEDFDSCWKGCTGLVSMPAIDATSSTYNANMFDGCSSLVCLTSINTTNSSSNGNMFLGCTSLVAPTTVEQTDLSDATGAIYVNAGACPLLDLFIIPVESTAIAKSVNPTVVITYPSVTVTPATSSAIAKSVNPTTLQSDINLTPVVSSAIATAYVPPSYLEHDFPPGINAGNFGTSISLSGDGTRCIVGDDQDSTSGAANGIVYIYLRTTGTWTLEQTINNPIPGGSEYFGSAVAMDNTGTRCIIGERGDDSGPGGNYTGSVRIYYRSGTTWSLEQLIYNPNPTFLDVFGGQVAVTDDGDRFIVSAYLEDVGVSGSGSAYIYSRSDTTWSLEQQIDNPATIDTSEFFSFGIDISADGSLCIIGEPNNKVGASSDVGTVHIYSRSGTTWTSDQQLDNPNAPTAGDGFGNEVSISSDGTRCIVGAPQYDTPEQGSGAAYIYLNTAGTWSLEQSLYTPALESLANFGISVSISSDGLRCIVGEMGNDTYADRAGAVRRYFRSDTTWTLEDVIYNPEPAVSDFFGTGVDMSNDGTQWIVGGYGNVGQAYAYYKEWVYVSETIIPTAATAITKSVNPSVVQDSITITPAATSAIAASINPTVVITAGDVTVTPAVVSAIAKSVNPLVAAGTVITPVPVSAIGNTVDPNIVISGTQTVIPLPATAGTNVPYFNTYVSGLDHAFRVQHRVDYNVPESGGSWGLLPEVDTSKSLVLNTNNRYMSGGQPGNITSNLETDELSLAIELTNSSTVSYYREATANREMAAHAAVWEYTGIPNGPNEFKVIASGREAFSAVERELTVGLSGVTNINDCVVFIRGFMSPITTSTGMDDATAIAWLSDANTLTIRRGGDTDALSVDYTIVEFTGSNWTIHHAHSTAATDTGTLTLYDGVKGTGTPSSVAVWTDAAIIHHFQGDTSSLNYAIVDTSAQYLPDTTSTVDWFMDGGADHVDDEHLIYVIENSDWNVGHYTKTPTTAPEGDWTVDISAQGLTDFGQAFCIGSFNSAGTGTAYGRGLRNFHLNSLTEAAAYCHRSGNQGYISFQVIDLVGMDTGGLLLTTEAASSIAKSINPTVTIVGGGEQVTPDPATSIAKTINPTVIQDSITVSPTAVNSVAKSVNPAVVQSSITVTPAITNAIAKSINPTVNILGGGVAVTPAAVTAIAKSVNPVITVTQLVVSIQSLDTTSSNTINCSHDFEVDWGSGSYTAYVAGDAIAVATGTGAIRVRSINAVTQIKFVTNTFTAIDITAGSTLTDATDMCLDVSNLTSFDIDDSSNIITFTNSWQGCSGLLTFPLIDTSGATTLVNTWNACTSLTSFPLIDTSGVIEINAAWANCYNLTSFPLIDTSGVTSIAYAWYSCAGITSFPLIDTSNVSNFSYTWSGCSSLTSFPLINTVSAITMRATWYICSGIIGAFPLIDTSSVTSVLDAWRGCSGITSFPLFDTSSVTNFESMFFGCSGVTSFPTYITSAGLSFKRMFRGCTGVTELPLIDTSLGTNFESMFFGVSNVTELPFIDTSSGTNFFEFCRNCTNLTAIPLFDFALGTNFHEAFYDCASLTSMPAINTVSGTLFTEMFWGCSSLVCLSTLNTTLQTDTTDLFTECTALVAPTTAEQTLLLAGYNYVNAGDCPFSDLFIVPATVTAIAKSLNPAVQQGDVSITPAAATSIAKSIDPTTVQGDINITPTVISAAALTIDPTVQITGGGTFITPNASTAIAKSVNPTVVVSGVVAAEYDAIMFGMNF